MHLLDVAGGTGDIATRFLRPARRARAEVTLVDINHAMLSVGRDRALDPAGSAEIDWVAGDAMALPFPDRTFDAVTIAFGIRNVTRIDRALARGAPRAAARRPVPVPGVLHGRPAACWTGSTTPIRSTWCRCSAAASPSDEASYRYLVESIRRFPDQAAFATLMREAGLEQVASATSPAASRRSTPAGGCELRRGRSR